MIVQLFQYFITTIAIVLALLFSSCLLCNWMVILSWIFVKKHRSPSPIVGLGPVLGSIALIIFPFYDLKMYWWIPFAVDVLSVYMMPEVIRLFFLEKQSTK